MVTDGQKLSGFYRLSGEKNLIANVRQEFRSKSWMGRNAAEVEKLIYKNGLKQLRILILAFW